MIEGNLSRESVVLVAAHPDDETIGAGALLARIPHLVLVHVTDGAPRPLEFTHAAGFTKREDYAGARRKELRCALALAGVPPDRACSLDVADQEASLQMADLAVRLQEIFEARRPAAVLTHPYEGGHPDHDATALIVHAACARMRTPTPIYEFTSYHASAFPAGDGCACIEVGRFLSDDGVEDTVYLNPSDRERKHRMLQCFASQFDMLRQFPVDVERFRRAPVYDFALPPHPGKLFYDHFRWGMTGERWRQLANAALRTLKIQNPL